ncbi:type III glutamate--ammonia ligase [Betaproteobacteria bacterium]|nr:type III glutamate--ammonia ligase [Betaproteobacteria bacterium]GHU44427.1 type III glutamate--ammonia ligase [Betaproteobacteria bacterium]
MTPDEAKKFLTDHHVKYVFAQFVDIHGAPKVKVVPADHFDDIINNGAGFAGGAVWGLGLEPASPQDYMAVGDLSTLTLVPWQPGYARIVCDGHVDKKPWKFDSRVVLKKQVARLRARGLTFYTGLEPEFSLLKKNDRGDIVPCEDSDVLKKPCYDYKGLSRSREFLERLTDSVKVVGLDVYQIDHEDANGQFEINYTFDDCLSSCDDFIFFKMAASEIAHEMGLICSFMPKPFANRPGNGMHIHMSLGDGKQNVFEDKSDPRGLKLSKLAYHFLGGILKHAPALAAVCAPTVNSYKRLVVGQSLTGATWAPAYISYGDNNRSTMVRIPGGRLELRIPDGACNPYLATAAVIAAGLDGIDREIDPGEPKNNNLYDLTPSELKAAGIGTLPQSLHEALFALERDHVLCESLGPVAEEFLKLKNMEYVEYMRHVSDWEVERYLEFF